MAIYFSNGFIEETHTFLYFSHYNVSGSILSAILMPNMAMRNRLHARSLCLVLSIFFS